MILPALDRAILVGSCALFAQPRATYVPKTGQTGQTGQSIENARKSGASFDQKLTTPHAKLASGNVLLSDPGAQDVGRPIHSAHAHPSDGAPQS
jgi:hypothetical protein